VSVWKDSRELGRTAGEVAVALAGGATFDQVEGAAIHHAGRQHRLVHPARAQPITRDNLNLVLDAGWIAKDMLCQGVNAADVAVCQ
jgi:D-xylose transport system substrate-binding protein